jgi:three-Cys-motif partner protein
MERNCSKICLIKKENGNCSILGKDNLPLQCVGSWVEEKFYFLERYLNATCKARKKFSTKGNAVFIDLFAGPGRCIIMNAKKEIDSGGMRALLREEASFNELYYFDIDKENANALKIRLQNNPKCLVQEGDSNILIINLMEKLLKNPQKYHFVFIDPFGPSGLKFKTIKYLSQLKRLDMLIHFPIGAIKRNYKQWIKNNDGILDEFLGTKEWRDKILNINQSKITDFFLNIYKNQLKKIGFKEEGLRVIINNNFGQTAPIVNIRNTKNVNLYILILVSKHPIAQKIWSSIIKIDATGQKQLF